MIRAQEMSRKDIRQIVRTCFDGLSAAVDDGFMPDRVEPHLERVEQVSLATECIEGLTDQIDRSHFDQTINGLAESALSGTAFHLADQSPARRLDLLEGLARAVIEQQRLFMHRLEDRLLPYRPSDELFGARPEIECAGTQNAIRNSVGPTLEDAVTLYLEAGAERWRGKTHTSRVRMLSYLVEHVGAARPLMSIEPHDVRGFRDAVLSLRCNYGRKPGLSFAAKQTSNKIKRIAPKTARLIFEPCKAFFAWCTNVEGYLASNPADKVRIETGQPKKVSRARRGFDAAELRTIFTAPMFTGCKSVHRRFDPGPIQIRDGKFWLPLLGYYTGARLGELVQLQVRDVHLEAGVPHISINEDNGPGTSPDERKHVKSKAGIRCVPLHPALLTLGFAEFVQKRSKKLGKGRVRLFGEFKFGIDGQASTEASKWFGRFLDRAGLTGNDLVFHSFRHGAEDAFRNAKQPQYLIDKIVGHSDGAVSSVYGQGVSLDVAYQAMCEAKFPLDVRDILSGV
ncbi:MAG TPA: site-specific integrase [Sphingomicrobium sp.]|nr:site-specific integrase [Sphingomicrobium sp.]